MGLALNINIDYQIAKCYLPLIKNGEYIEY